MQRFRFVQAWLLAAVVLTALAAPRVCAQYFYIPYIPRGPFMSGPMTRPYTPYTNYYYTYPSSIPYAAPYPAYGILPQPLALASLYGMPIHFTSDRGTASDVQPRARGSVYPAVPYEKPPADRLADLRRVHFEITVPYENAVVYIDGAKTKQTGLKRSFVTPPLQEDRYYTATVKVEWVDQFQKTRERSQSFNVVAGETVRHTFTE